MRRFLSAALCLLLMLSLAAPAQAATTASRISVSAAVGSSGSCQVTVDLQLHLDAPDRSLTFPLPGNARSVSINGSIARTRRSNQQLLVDLTSVAGKVAGDFTVRLQYTLPNIVRYNELEKLEMTLPMLSGFSYPVDSFAFTVTLPGDNAVKPIFSSGYYQQSIEADVTYTMSGPVISGSLSGQLKDRETFTMTLEVSPDLFPQDPLEQWSLGLDGVTMILLAALAALYWLIFLRSAPLLRRRCALPPEGCTAGELTCALTGQGIELTMTVLSWAQMGYILLHINDSGRVMLHKRMDMGNERDSYEVKLFRQLFGKRSVVDGTGYHYARLCRKAAASPGSIRELYRRSSGNPLVLRVLCAGIGLMGSICIGIGLAGDALLGILLIVILALLGTASSWLMQTWFMGLHLNRKDALYLSAGLGVLWILLGLAGGELAAGLGMVAAQLLGGLLWAYGGRRTPYGRQTAREILGLRQHLRKLSKSEAQRLTAGDPEYFFDMAPYALALGVGRPFAKAFGPQRLSGCPWLTTGMDGHMTAAEWMALMEQTVGTLDHRQRWLPLERLLGK